MNGYERIKAALEGRPTDKVPIMLHNFMMAAQEYGVTMEAFRNSPALIVKSFIHSIEKYQYDGILVDLDTVTLAGALGTKIHFPLNEPARAVKGILESLDNISDLQQVDIRNYRYIQVWLEAVKLLKDHFKNEIFIRGNCDQAPFSLASMLRGTENWMMDLLTANEGDILRLLEYCAAAGCRFINLMAETGCDMVSNGDSPAGPDLTPPEIYEKFALPFEKILVDTAHKHRLPYALHICGNTDQILDKMLLTGAEAYELDYKTDIRKAHEFFKDTATLIGNIDPSGVLALGSPEEVHIKTRELLEVYSDSPRFILNAGCALPATTPEENIKTMIQTARNFR